MVRQRIGDERRQPTENPLFIGIDRQAALRGNPFYRRTKRGYVIAVADIIAVEVKTGFAAVSFPAGDKRADLFIPQNHIDTFYHFLLLLTRLGISFSISRSAIGGIGSSGRISASRCS